MKSLSVVTPSPACIVELDQRRMSSPASSVSSRSSYASNISRSSLSRSAVDGNKIRSRLLTTLGIVQHPKGIRKTARPPEMRKVAPFSVPLKYEPEDDEKTEASSVSSSPSSRKSVVAFDNEVSVVPIPKHQEYSQRIRSRLWCDKRELRTMAARNTLEYQSEGWNPSTVVEDEGFITTACGERIHPVHLHRLLSSPFLRQPMKIMQLRAPLDASRQPIEVHTTSLTSKRKTTTK